MRDVRIELEPLNLVTGPNGSGKSSLYRALRLLAEIAQGRIIQSLAAEGGLQSTLWAGPETFSRAMKERSAPVQGALRRAPVSMRLGFASEDYGYAIDLGLPRPSASAFSRDPEIKLESLWLGQAPSPRTLIAERRGPHVRVRGESGQWNGSAREQAGIDSMMTHCADARDGIELLQLRERMRAWRFYDQLRTDLEAPARRPQVGTHTPVLAGDGADLAAAIQTIVEIGDRDGLDEAIDDAFPGSSLAVAASDGYFELEMRQEGLLRPLRSAELSDGTLRYLLLIAALLSPRPPPLMVLNEPEASLHPDLLAPLARLVARAAGRSQIILISHVPVLIAALEGEAGCTRIALDKELGETVVRDRPAAAWTWPSR